jgi:hypothetical protein
MQPSPTDLTQAAHTSKPGRVLGALFLAAFSLAVLVSSAVAGGNLVKNGSFEKGSGGIPNNWSGYQLIATDKRVCNKSYAGSCSFKMVGEGGGFDKSLIQGLAVSGGSGDTYQLKIRVRTKDLVLGAGFATIYLVLYQTDGGYDQAALNIAEGTSGGWDLYTLDLTATENYDAGAVQVDFNGNLGKGWFDKVKLVEVP